MLVTLNGSRFGDYPPGRESSAGCIDIGLINNMPDSALQAAERQFLGLLSDASAGVTVRVSLFTMPGVPRADESRNRIRALYSNIEDLWTRRLDGLIVTGAEPRTPNLVDEPYWGDFTRILDWADQNTLSSVWSCLAAHMAVLYLDDIRRHRLSNKRSGVFESARTCDHPLMDGLPLHIRMPHSRWNEVREEELSACGYRILARGGNGDVDIFSKQRKSCFLFFQGHPEYEADTLFREFRRDVRRYLKGEADTYPGIPQGYIDGMEDVFTEWKARAPFSRSEALLAAFPTAMAEHRLLNTWRHAALQIYSNWLAYLGKQKGLWLQNEACPNGACVREPIAAGLGGGFRLNQDSTSVLEFSSER